MTYQVHDTAEWPILRLAPYLNDLLKEFDKLHQRFPHDITVESLFHEYLTGQKRLFLVVDEDEKLVAFAMTRLTVINASGKVQATLMDLAGENVAAWAQPLGAVLEAWARQNNAHFAAIEGRPGWMPLLKAMGYQPFAVMMRKEL